MSNIELFLGQSAPRQARLYKNVAALDLGILPRRPTHDAPTRHPSVEAACLRHLHLPEAGYHQRLRPSPFPPPDVVSAPSPAERDPARRHSTGLKCARVAEGTSADGRAAQQRVAAYWSALSSPL